MPRILHWIFALGCLALVAEESAAQDGKLLKDSAGSCAEPLAFTHVLTDKPLPQYKPDEEITPAVDEFHCSGEDPYNGDDAVIADGKKLYTSLCASCHLPDGSGRIGPSLIDSNHKYQRVTTDKGEFEVIYGGAAGAMQPMGRRFTQDQILRIMAYVASLPKK
jgi:cytochrome c-L